VVQLVADDQRWWPVVRVEIDLVRGARIEVRDRRVEIILPGPGTWNRS